MADQNLELALKIRADLQQARGEIRALADSLKATDQAGRQADGGLSATARGSKKASDGLNDVDKSAKNTKSSVSQLRGLLTRMAGLLGAAFTVREIAQAVETYTTIKNRLALVTDGAEGLAAAQDDVFQSAQRAGQPLDATAELYQRIATNAKELQLSAAGVAAVVDTVNKTMVISGTSGAGASAAMVQLGQAFAAGTLRGEELNSVLEQAPALAKTIADGLDVPVGKLKELAEKGELTIDRVIQALLSQGAAVDEQFGRMEVTGKQAMTKLGNSLISIIGQLNEAAGASTEFGNVLDGISTWLDSGALTDGMITSFSVWSQTISAFISDLDDLSAEFDAVGNKNDSISERIARAFIRFPANVRAFVQVANIEQNALLDKLTAFPKAYFRGVRDLFTKSTVNDALTDYKNELVNINNARWDTIDYYLDEYNGIIKNSQAEKERLQAERKAREEDRAARKAKIEALRKNAGEDKSLIKSISKEEQKKIDQAEQYVRNLEKQFEMFGKTAQAVREYEIQERALTGQHLARARAASMAIAAQERLTAMQDIKIRVAELQGQPLQAQMMALKNQYASLLTDLGSGPVVDEAGQALVKKLINLELIQTRLTQMQEAIDKSLQAQARAEQSINVQQDSGLIGEIEARDRILQLHRQTYTELAKQRPLLDELARIPGTVGEQAKIALEELNNQMMQLQATTSLLQSALKEGLQSGLSDAISGLADGTLSLRGAVASLAQSVANAMLKIVSNGLAEDATRQVMSMFSQTSAAAAASAATSSAAQVASIGTVTVAKTTADATMAGSAVIAANTAAAGTAPAAAATTAAWAPAAAVSSVASWGGAAAIGIAALLAVLALARTFAIGGHVRGPGTGTSDSIPAMLSDNEFVTRAAVVQQPGALAFLGDFNARGMQALDAYATVRHATGGLAGIPAPSFPVPSSQIMQPSLSQPQAQNGGNSSPIVVQVNNALDADDLAQSVLSSSAAVRQIKNIFKAEKSSFRAILEG